MYKTGLQKSRHEVYHLIYFLLPSHYRGGETMCITTHLVTYLLLFILLILRKQFQY